MKAFRIVIFALALMALIGCDDDSGDKGLTSATVLSVSTEECYCCSGVTLEIGGEAFLAETIPENIAVSNIIQKGQFPISVMVETSQYSGTCPNHDIDVKRIELLE